MNKNALFIIPSDRFNEDELFHPKEVLENAGVKVTIASTKIGEITGDNQGKTKAEVIFSEVPVNDYDIIAVIGGSGTIDYLWENQTLISYLKQAYEQKVLLTGICAGSVVIAQTGLLSGRQATCYPVDVMINALKDNNVEYIAKHVIVHNDIITSDGPDGAKEFGESLIKALI
ncbi:DJ-1/PfpI family protein [Bacillus sp. S13(2024)]|uniref:DJ-1/PfpI family protein n=1 Tax=unclassified Bacillus (in: firmicutes) TaxID=185979 RepID=UPI003D19812B